MTNGERERMVDNIVDYILQRHFAAHNVSYAEALSVLCSVIDRTIRFTCSAAELDPEEMTTHFCNALQQPLKKERHYSTGSGGTDELMQLIVDEVKAGGDIEEIVDKYISCETPELRKDVIDGIRRIRNTHHIDNVTVGY